MYYFTYMYMMYVVDVLTKSIYAVTITNNFLHI